MTKAACEHLAGGVGKVFQAASVTIIDHGHTVLDAAVGEESPDSGRPATTSSLFDLASLTKPIISTLTLMLIQRELLSLDEPVARTIPTFRGDGKEKVTILNLLTHTSGLPPSYNFYDPALLWKKPRKDVFDVIMNISLTARPGEKCVYSCIGFMVLTALLEARFGRLLDDLLAEYLTRPLDLTNIVFNPRAQTGTVTTEAERPNRGPIAPGMVHDGGAAALSGVSGNAGLFASSSDLAAFGHCLLSGKILNSPLAKEATSLHSSNEIYDFGLGWRLNVRNQFRISPHAYGHTGFTGTAIWIEPDRERVLSILTNSVCFRDEPSAGSVDQWRSRLFEIVNHN